MPFLLRLDCAALPRVPGLALPADGTLLFFLDQESALDACGIEPEQEFARVVYVLAGAETADGEYVVPADTEMEPFLAPEHEMYAGLQAELPDWLDRSEEWLCDTQIQLLRDMPHRKEMSALVEQLWPERNWHLPDDVFVGGYTLSAQDPPRGDHDGPGAGSAAVVPARAERMEARYEEQQRVMREWCRWPSSAAGRGVRQRAVPDPPRRPRRPAVRQGAVLLRVHRVTAGTAHTRVRTARSAASTSCSPLAIVAPKRR
ncbi:DUF1963 domain-containing protein [Micromonospora sp. BRA006-A]|nr:DUF1963 domain-containing protein [Micromonospora sp. BRA006-A]